MSDFPAAPSILYLKYCYMIIGTSCCEVLLVFVEIYPS